MTETQERPAAATEPRGLSPAELKTLEKLLVKANIGVVQGPGVRVGREYVALTNLSVPRRDNTKEDRQVDLVPAGDTVWLTDDEAAKFLRHGDRDGRRVAVIRLKSEVDANRPPKPHPSLLSGPIMRPVQPPPGTDMARPDPEGASRLVEQTVSVPEAQTVEVAQGGTPSIQDAIDIVPGGGGPTSRTEVMVGADQDLMAAVKAQNPGLTGRKEK
jgi:hypothetical protein